MELLPYDKAPPSYVQLLRQNSGNRFLEKQPVQDWLEWGWLGGS